MRFIEITIETIELTIYLSISIYYLITNFYLLYFSLIPSTNKISYFKAKCLLKLLYCFFFTQHSTSIINHISQTMSKKWKLRYSYFCDPSKKKKIFHVGSLYPWTDPACGHLSTLPKKKWIIYHIEIDN